MTHCLFFSMLARRSSSSSMGDEEESRELSDGLKEGELLSPCSTDSVLGRSSRACVGVTKHTSFQKHKTESVLCQRSGVTDKPLLKIAQLALKFESVAILLFIIPSFPGGYCTERYKEAVISSYQAMWRCRCAF